MADFPISIAVTYLFPDNPDVFVASIFVAGTFWWYFLSRVAGVLYLKCFRSKQPHALTCPPKFSPNKT
jgi:ABC-type anion transport system duplicated permease subunit